MAIRFQQLNQALAKLRNTWPTAAEVLESRYRAVDERPVSSGVEAKGDAEKWAKLRTAFSASNLYDVQARLVGELEQTRIELVGGTSKPTADESSKLADFLGADREFEALQSGWLGNLSKVVYRLKVPDRIYPILSN